MLANLRALFGGVVDITFFRSGPESLPASQALLAIVVVLFIAVSVVMSALVSLPVADALAGAVLGSVVMLAWFRAALAIANKRERFLQTCTAIFGVNLVFQPALVPLAGALKPYFEKADPTVAPPAARSIRACWRETDWLASPSRASSHSGSRPIRMTGPADSNVEELPDVVVACVGGGSNAIGAFNAFLDEEGVQLFGVEAAGDGVDTERHAATLSKGRIGVLHGMKSYVLQTEDGQVQEAHSTTCQGGEE